MLISEGYCDLQRELHGDCLGYGVACLGWLDVVDGLCEKYGFVDILDYGCGKGRLGIELSKRRKINYFGYDPAVEGFSDDPGGSNFVVCIDVLEHIEPDCLDAVLTHLSDKVLELGFFTIATGPAGKFLGDGRNAHLIQEGQGYWIPKIMDKFKIRSFTDYGNVLGFVVVK